MIPIREEDWANINEEKSKFRCTKPVVIVRGHSILPTLLPGKLQIKKEILTGGEPAMYHNGYKVSLDTR